MTTSMIPVPIGNPEVVFEIPMVIRIAALLRHWGYLVAPNDSGYKAAGYDYRIGSNSERLVIGYTVKRKISEVKRVRRGWFRWSMEVVESEAVEKHDAGEIAAPYDDLAIDAYAINTITYLAEIAARLQKELGKPVKVRLARIGNVPLAAEGQSFPLLVANNHDNTAEALIQMVAKRLESNTQIQANPDKSIDLWTSGEAKPARLLTATSEVTADGSIQLSVSIHRSGITQMIEEEVAGIEESLRYKGKQLSVEIKEMH